jgi:hypothetical protein
LDRVAKQLEQQTVDMQVRNDELARQLQELQNWKNRAANETADLQRCPQAKISIISR